MTYFSALPLKQDQSKISNTPNVGENKQQTSKSVGWGLEDSFTERGDT